jgi:oxygen-independent coproporphyrinogen-3 oxidase
MTVRPAQRLYVHVPFCRARCAYCAFVSEAPPDPRRMERYLCALERELASAVRQANALDSVYVGGGTPTALGPRRLTRLLELVRQHVAVTAQTEWTVEANPDALDPGTVAALASAGVNRVSLGLQSFDDDLRRTLGRQVDPGGTADAVTALRRAGICRVNADLIFQIPGQTLAQWTEDLRRALDLGVTHLSAYALTLEEGTRLAASAPVVPDEDCFLAMWDATDEMAHAYGLRRYEISNLAEPGHECRHNLEIWYGDPYAGCGPAAASFDGRRRWTNPPGLDAWLRGQGPEVDDIPDAARAAEILAFGLRTVAGWDLDQFQRVTGADLGTLCPAAIAELVAAGLLELVPGRLRPTPRGLLLHDTVAERILLPLARE